MLVSLVSLLRVDSQAIKPQLQRLFLNLCRQHEQMRCLIRMLLSLLRAPLSMDEVAATSQQQMQLPGPSSGATLSDALKVCLTSCPPYFWS